MILNVEIDMHRDVSIDDYECANVCMNMTRNVRISMTSSFQ